MDVEARLVLYTVLLGAGSGLGLMLRRRVSGFGVYRIELAVLAAVSLAGLLSRETGRVVAWPSFWAFVAVAIVPSGLIQAARRATRARRFGLASAAASGAGLLLGRPAVFRREAALYGAMEAAERGDAALCRSRLERMDRDVGIPAELGGAALVRTLPAAALRRWDEVLDALASMPYRPPSMLALEVRAAADTGDLDRALRACREIETFGPTFAAARIASRRWLLAAAGRAEFLAEAARRRLPVMSGPPGTIELALARADEARGDVASAAVRYAAASRVAVGGQRLDADVGARRCADGAPLVTAAAGLDSAPFLELEEACRRETLPPDELPLARRAPFTVAASVVTAAVSALVVLALGIDRISLVSVGALSAPLIRAEGEWWRLASTMLLHSGWFHLAMNLGAILFVGIPLETRVGPARTAIVYVGSGLLASLASVYLAGTDVGVGASGAAMGLVGALGVLLLRRRALFQESERSRWLFALALTIAATLALGIAESEAIDNTAHAAGALAGALIGWSLLPDPAERHGRLPIVRIAAVASCVLMAASGVAAVSAFRVWRTERVVEFPGGSVVLPAWLHVRPLAQGGVVAMREPIGFAVELGSMPAEPDPMRLMPPDEFRRLLLQPPDTVSREVLDTGTTSETEDRRVPDGVGLRLRTFRTGGAFALAVVPLGPDGETEGDDVAVRIGRSLRAVE